MSLGFKMSSRVLATLLLLCGVLLVQAGCGARFGAGRAGPSIDVLRKRAEKHPKDVKAWTELAVAEHLEDGGEPKRAREALAHARALGAKSLALSFVEAEEHVLEGRSEAALVAYLKLLEESSHSDDPLAHVYAEVSIAAVGDMNDAVDDYRPRVEAAVEALAPRARSLGLSAAHQLAMARFGFAMMHGDQAKVAQIAKAAGCVQAGEVAGPFGPRELLGFDQSYPAEAKGPLQKAYDLGPGRGMQPVRKLDTKRCVLAVGRGVRKAWPGTNIVRSEVSVPSAGDYALRIESPNSLVVWLDGREVHRVDLRNKVMAGVRYVPLELGAGTHELKVKLSTRHPNPALSLVLLPAKPSEVEATTLPKPNTSLERFLVAKVALARGDAVSARELLRKSGQKAPTAHTLVLEAATALADPLRSPELRRDLSRELLRRAAQQNPDAWYPAVGIANLAGSEGRLKEAIEELRTAVKKWPEVIAIRTSLIEQLRENGFVEEAEATVRDLAQRMPHACAVIGIELNTARARGRIQDIEKLTDEAMKCDASSTARAALLRTQRKYDDAAAEYLRLFQLGDILDEAQKLEADLEYAQLAGDKAKARKLRELRAERFPDRAEPVLDRADLLLAEGKQKEAVSYLAKSIAAHPDELYELRQVSESLGAEELFAGFRKNGAEVIKAFEAGGRKYDQPQVLVLDYTVVRLFEDGSSVELTHNILRMQSQEAVDENGEYQVPEGARLLTLHTVKADGTRLEPEAIAGKSSLSLPNLSVGDYVEFETVRGESPSVGFPGGYIGNRFYFQSFEVPFDHTELVVVLPQKLEPVLDPRGPAPQTVRESKDGLTVLRWRKNESRPLTQEPLSVSSREFIPSINLGLKASWEAYVESLRDLLADKDVYDPAAYDEVHKLLGDEMDAKPSVRAARLYRWVTEQIEPTDNVFGGASAMLAARTGSRERVLRYMLQLAGVQSDLVLARGAEADHSQAKLPDPDTYGYLLLRVATESGPVWLSAGARHAPFGYLPPQLWGEQALLVGPGAQVVALPNPKLEAGLRNIDADVQLKADGSAEVHIKETHRGPSAVNWRDDLDEIPGAELNARFEEAYAVQLIPGARLTKLTITGREDAEAPLVLDYTVEVASLGHRVGNQQRIPPLFGSMLSSRYARAGERKTAELAGPSQAADVKIRVALPQGARVASSPRSEKLGYQGATFSSSVRVEGGNVEIARSLRMPQLRVTPEEYQKLATFCRYVDLTEGAELAVTLP